MFQIKHAIASLLILPVAIHAHAGITSIDLGTSGNVAGENWAAGFHWNVRALLLDSSRQPIGALTPAVVFDTTAGAATPELVKVFLDGPAPAGTVVRVYRSTNPFNVGFVAQYADYTALCPCVAGDLLLSTSGHVTNADFASSETTMPVTLQNFSVD